MLATALAGAGTPARESTRGQAVRERDTKRRRDSARSLRLCNELQQTGRLNNH